MTLTNTNVEAAQETLAALEEALADLEARRASIHPDRFALTAEPIVADIQRLRVEAEAKRGSGPSGSLSADSKW